MDEEELRQQALDAFVQSALAGQAPPTTVSAPPTQKYLAVPIQGPDGSISFEFHENPNWTPPANAPEAEPPQLTQAEAQAIHDEEIARAYELEHARQLQAERQKNQTAGKGYITDAEASVLDQQAKERGLTQQQINIERERLAQQGRQLEADLGLTAATTARTEAETEETRANVQQILANTNLTEAQKQQVLADIGLIGAQQGKTEAEIGQVLANTNLTQAQQQAVIAELGLIGAQTRETGARATQEEARAGVAPEAAQAEVDLALGNIRSIQLGNQQLEAELRTTTDADRRQAIQMELRQGQADLDTTIQQIENLKYSGQLTGAQIRQVDQAIETSRESVEAAKMGGLYGLQDRIDEIKRQIASGTLKPEDGDALLNDYINATIAGTTPFEARTTRAQEETQRIGQRLSQRGQDVDLAGTQTSTLGSFGSSIFGQLANLNQYAEPGTSGGAAAFRSAVDYMKGQFPEAPAPVEVPGVPAFLPGGQGGGQAAGSVVINIGGGGGGGQPAPQTQVGGASPWGQSGMNTAAPNPTPSLQPFMDRNLVTGPLAGPGSLGPSGMPAALQAGAAAAPAMVDAMRPASPEDVDRLWGQSR
ncbi:MAG: hypothetical protein GEU71_03620 [Actinobacteria bacterium]|nr:hypothetical protein [Actinomycetota bacterium]